jgi:hypothetical protein
MTGQVHQVSEKHGAFPAHPRCSYEIGELNILITPGARAIGLDQRRVSLAQMVYPVALSVISCVTAKTPRWGGMFAIQVLRDLFHQRARVAPRNRGRREQALGEQVAT